MACSVEASGHKERAPDTAGSEADTRQMPTMDANALVRFGFPKGSLQKVTSHFSSWACCCARILRTGAVRGHSTENLFRRAGFQVEISERGYFPRVNDDALQLVLFRCVGSRAWRTLVADA
eukprot:364743-Chlamydomonas_euryale.AAC.36